MKVLIYLMMLLSLSLNAKMVIPDPEMKNYFGQWWVFATALPNLSALEFDRYKDHEIEFGLSDGTRVGGLYFAKGANYPLLIGTFGFLADRWSQPCAQFVRDYVEKGLIEANVLIVDHPTSFPFFLYNGNLSIGGYDEGRMLLGVASTMKRYYGDSFTTINLLGISMGGMGVVHAALEDRRLKRNLINSVATFSGVTDFKSVPYRQLKLYDSAHYPEIAYEEPLQLIGLSSLFGHNFDAIKYLERSRLNSANEKKRIQTMTNFPFPWESTINDFYEEQFLKRFKTYSWKSNWNPEISRSSFSAYVKDQELSEYISMIRIPLVAIFAEDDKAVPVEQFENVYHSQEAIENDYVSAKLVPFGAHFGFNMPYGAQWGADIINRTMGTMVSN